MIEIDLITTEPATFNVIVSGRSRIFTGGAKPQRGGAGIKFN